MTPHPRVPLVLVSGLTAEGNDELAALLRRAGPGVAVVHHDLRQIGNGIVRRRIRLGPCDQLTALELAHGCVNCTLREDLLPLLRRLARRPEVDRIVLRLDEAMEPEPVSWAIANVLVGDRPVSQDVEIEAVFTTVDRAAWLADVSGDDLLLERGLQGSPEDERTVAQVALAQVEFADVLVLAGDVPDAWCAAKTAAVLDRVAPSVPRVVLKGVNAGLLFAAVPAESRRGEVIDLHGALLRGQPPLHADCGVEVLTFTSQRPFHPERLHEAIDTLLGGVIRTRGRAWVASQPDIAFWLESAGGGLAIGHAGPWLASPDGPDWAAVSPERRTLASLRWHPVHGDRAQELVVVTDLVAPKEIEDALRVALLTDDELAEGEAAWRSYPDPFGEWHEDPCEATEDDAEDQERHVNATNRKEEPQ
ncbi:GTP-binding protein [Amycolatopsis sp. NPDC023774]|uniref:ribosome hibernation factor-recruiting GTPase MRF n=1 Tax=Amycolatopsis sp. NPDC023774 TaxID=3155015 RepID=UPI0033F6D8AE